MLSNIKEQLKDAMFKKDKERINALRNIIAKVKMKEIQKNKELTNEEIQKVLQSMAKQLKDSINQYSDGGRLDLADNESKELDILSEFLPEDMSQEEINSIIDDVISELNASSIKDLGRVMGLAISKIQGRADGSVISKLVKERLS
tara:strand:+ start:76 stop:513 length:438 start_codon:yes stop_codon:yes gene_type:complete